MAQPNIPIFSARCRLHDVLTSSIFYVYTNSQFGADEHAPTKS